MAKDFTYTLGSTDSVPASTALTGTISILADKLVVTATGGAFLTEVQAGSAIYDVTNGEIQIVDRVMNDNSLVLKEAFSTNSASAKVIKRPRVNWLSVVAVAGALATINGELLYEGVPVTRGGQDSVGETKPVVVAVNGATIGVSYRTV